MQSNQSSSVRAFCSLILFTSPRAFPKQANAHSAVLKLNGVDAKQHPIFTELTRVKQYFEKVKDSENGGPAKRAKSRLNVPAAGRFIKADLAGNDKFEKERAERLAAVKKGALTKLDNRDVTPVSSSISPSKKRKADAELNEGSSPAKTRRVEAVVDGLAHEERDAVAEKYDAELLDTSPKPAIDDAEAAAAKRELKKAKKERKRERENEADGIVRRHSKHDTSKKSKSSKPPRNTKTVFKDLLNGKEGAANT